MIPYSWRFQIVGVPGAAAPRGSMCGKSEGGYFDVWSNRLTISAVMSRFLS
jgi:hypothetical protein